MTHEKATELLRKLNAEMLQTANPLKFQYMGAIATAVSALAQPEIIKCPDCKYYDAPVCDLHIETGHRFMTSRNGFCYHAKRREEEHEK